MRNVHLSKYERVAGLFVLAALVGAIFSAFSVAIKQGWFEAKAAYTATFENADGLHAGATVKMAGLNAGSIDDVELLPNNKVRVNFRVLKRFSARIREDSRAQLIRPFVIGDRVLDITVGSENARILPPESDIKSEETMDIMTVMSGKRMGTVFTRVGALMESLQTVAEAFSDQGRMHSVVRMFDRMEPLIEDLGVMSKEITKLSRQATKDGNLGSTLANASLLIRELNLIVPEMLKQNPEMAKDLAGLTRSLSRMSIEMEAAMVEVGPEGRTAAKKAFEALNEATTLMKALQKTFLLRSSVREVKEEDAAKKRLPAQAPDAD